MRVVSIEEMKELETEALERFQLEETLIIENVGLRGADFLHSSFLKKEDFGEIVLLVGRGNNGADGLAIGRHLTEYGHKVRAFMFFPIEECSKELKRQAVLAKGFGVKISEFEITKVDLPLISFRVICSKGTYIRSLANDFGRKLGVGAHLSSLRRTRIGTYHINNAYALNDFIKLIKSPE